MVKTVTKVRRLYSVLGSVLLVLVSGLWLLFSYRTEVIKASINYFSEQYQLDVIALEGLTLLDSGVKIAKLELRQQQSSLTISNLVIKFDQTHLPASVAVEHLRLKLDFDSVAWLNQQRTAGPSQPGEINLSDLPKITLALAEIELTNFSDQWLDPNLRHIRISDLRVESNKPLQLTAAIEFENLPLLEVSAAYVEQSIRATVTSKLAGSESLLESFLPPQAKLSGRIKADFDWQANNRQQLNVVLSLDQLSLESADVKLIEAVDVSAQTSLNWANSLALSPIKLNFIQNETLVVTEPVCHQLSIWFNQSVTRCRQLSTIGLISLQLDSALNAELNINPVSLANWSITSSEFVLKLNTPSEQATLMVKEFAGAADNIYSDWQLTGTSTRLEKIKQAKLALAGQLTKADKLTVTIEQAKLTIAQLNYLESGIGHLTLSSKDKFELVVANGEILPFNSKWHSRFNQVKHLGFSLAQVSANHQLRFSGSRISAHEIDLHTHWRSGDIRLTSNDKIRFENNRFTSASGDLRLAKQSLRPLLTLKSSLEQLWPEPLVTEPKIVQRIDYQVVLNKGKLKFDATVKGKLTADDVQYQELLASGLTSDWSCRIHYQGRLNADCKIGLDLSLLDIGLPVTKIKVRAKLLQNIERLVLDLTQAQGQLLGGGFKLKPIKVTDFNDIKTQVELTNISLKKLVELQQQPGIDVSGRLRGNLPIRYFNQQFSMRNGYLTSVAPGGAIQIHDNETINQLRLSQPQLKFVLDALEDLNYSELSSHIDYQADGATLIRVTIRGRNPTIERPIEFNYSHQENLLQLLRSLRIGDEISKKIENTTQ